MTNLEEWFGKLCRDRNPYQNETLLKIVLFDGRSFNGNFYGFTFAINNDPEIADIMIKRDSDGPGIVTVCEEPDIVEIEVLNCPGLYWAIFENNRSAR